jgi:pyrroloquinoline quinone (PQQ) biosynthesis protein C
MHTAHLPTVDETRQQLMRSKLINNRFFRRVKNDNVTRPDIALMLGQWWHPLHFFPDFLSRTIAVVPKLEAKTAISKILYQELGEGHAENAHESLYVSTMTAVGFRSSVLVNSSPLPATARLVNGYAKAAEQWQSALGFIYATETVDLFLVGSLGAAVTRVTGQQKLPWVEIHITQEPDHVTGASKALYGSLQGNEINDLMSYADTMWKLWDDFFSDLDEHMFRSHASEHAQAREHAPVEEAHR